MTIVSLSFLVENPASTGWRENAFPGKVGLWADNKIRHKRGETQNEEIDQRYVTVCRCDAGGHHTGPEYDRPCCYYVDQEIDEEASCENEECGEDRYSRCCCDTFQVRLSGFKLTARTLRLGSAGRFVVPNDKPIHRRT